MKTILLHLALFTSIIFFSLDANAQEAEKAWKSLTGKTLGKKEAFKYIDFKKGKANVLIYGDSISIGYTPFVRASLETKANVFRLYCNGGDSGSFIPKMIKMHTTMQNESLDKPWDFTWDIIHFNVGLHDLKYVVNGKLNKAEGTQVSTLAEYRKNLISIIDYLKKEAPQAQLIFATSTPIPEGEAGRIVGDAKKYNTVALSVLKSYPEIIINDLFTITQKNHSKWQRKWGDVHYNKMGMTAQAKQVSNHINQALLTKAQKR